MIRSDPARSSAGPGMPPSASDGGGDSSAEEPEDRPGTAGSPTADGDPTDPPRDVAPRDHLDNQSKHSSE